MTENKDRGHGEMGEDKVPLAKIVFRVPGVMPHHFEDEIIDPDNGIGAKIAKELVDAEGKDKGVAPRINWGHVIDNIESGKHKGFFVVTSGAIILTIGIEIKRHGRDIKELIHLVTQHKAKEGKPRK